MLVCSLCGHELVGSSSRRAVQTLFGPHGSPVDFSFDVFICASIKVTLKMFWDKWIHSSPLLHVQHISTVILMTCQLMNCGSQQQYVRPNWMDSPWSVELFTSLESKQNISHHTWVTGTKNEPVTNLRAGFTFSFTDSVHRAQLRHAPTATPTKSDTETA